MDELHQNETTAQCDDDNVDNVDHDSKDKKIQYLITMAHLCSPDFGTFTAWRSPVLKPIVLPHLTAKDR